MRHLLPRHPDVAGDPHRVRQLGERHCLGVPPGRRVRGRQDEMDGIAEELVALQPRRHPQRLVQPLVTEHEVDLAQRESGQRLLGLGLDQLAAQPRRIGRQRLHRRQGEPQRHGLKAGDPPAARDGAGSRGQIGLGERGARQQRLGVVDQHERRVGQPHAATGALEQLHAGLALEHRELLRDGRRRELERVGDCSDRLSFVQLAQEAQAVDVEHRAATLPSLVAKENRCYANVNCAGWGSGDLPAARQDRRASSSSASRRQSRRSRPGGLSCRDDQSSAARTTDVAATTRPTIQPATSWPTSTAPRTTPMPTIPPVAITRIKPRSIPVRRRSRPGTIPCGRPCRRASRSAARASRDGVSAPGSVSAGSSRAGGSLDSEDVTRERLPSGRTIDPAVRRGSPGLSQSASATRRSQRPRRSPSAPDRPLPDPFPFPFPFPFGPDAWISSCTAGAGAGASMAFIALSPA